MLKYLIQGGEPKTTYEVICYNDGTIERVCKLGTQGGCNIFVVGYSGDFETLSRKRKQAIMERDERNKTKILEMLERNLQRWIDEGKPIL